MSAETEYEEYRIIGIVTRSNCCQSFDTTVEFNARLNGRTHPEDKMSEVCNEFDVHSIHAVLVMKQGVNVFSSMNDENWKEKHIEVVGGGDDD